MPSFKVIVAKHITPPLLIPDGIWELNGFCVGFTSYTTVSAFNFRRDGQIFKDDTYLSLAARLQMHPILPDFSFMK